MNRSTFEMKSLRVQSRIRAGTFKQCRWVNEGGLERQECRYCKNHKFLSLNDNCQEWDKWQATGETRLSSSALR